MPATYTKQANRNDGFNVVRTFEQGPNEPLEPPSVPNPYVIENVNEYVADEIVAKFAQQ